MNIFTEYVNIYLEGVFWCLVGPLVAELLHILVEDVFMQFSELNRQIVGWRPPLWVGIPFSGKS